MTKLWIRGVLKKSLRLFLYNLFMGDGREGVGREEMEVIGEGGEGGVGGERR